MMKKWWVVLLSLIVVPGASLIAMEQEQKIVKERQALNASAELKKTQVIKVVTLGKLLSSSETLERAMVRDYGIPSIQGGSPESWPQFHEGSNKSGFGEHFFRDTLNGYRSDFP